MIGGPLLGCINTVSEEWSQWGAATGRLIGVGSGQGNPPTGGHTSLSTARFWATCVIITPAMFIKPVLIMTGGLLLKNYTFT